VVLFNAVTTSTIAIGVLTLYLALLAFCVIGSFSLIPQGAMEGEIGRNRTVGDYLQLAWLGASLATLAESAGGADRERSGGARRRVRLPASREPRTEG
jgi:hypothetical protein